MAQLFADNFNSGTNPDATYWTEVYASWSLSGGNLRADDGATIEILHTTAAAHAATLDVKVTITQRSATGDGGPIGRSTEVDSSPTCYAADVYSNKCEIYRYNNSASGTLLRTASITQLADAVVRLEVSGAGATVTLKQFYNGVQQGADLSDGDANRITTAGRTGVLVWIGQGDGVGRGDYDDFAVSDFLGAAALTGTVTANITEDDIVAGAETIVLTLDGDTYVPANSYGTPTYSTGATKGTTAADTANQGGGGRTGDGAMTCSWPAGYTPVAGHFAVMIVYNDQGDASTPTDWSEVSGSPFGSGTEKLCIFTKVLVGAEAAPVTTISGSGTNISHCAQMAIYTDVGSIGAIGAGNQGTGTPMTATGVTTTDDNSIVIFACGRGDNESASAQTFDASATGVTERLDGGTAAGTDSQVSMADKAFASASTATGDGASTTSTVDPWVAVILELKRRVATPFADARAALRSGLDSAQSEAAGWDAKVKPNIPLANIVRTSDTVVTITLQAQADYDITAQETITATIPASALAGGVEIVATPSFTVDPGSGATPLVGASASAAWAIAALALVAGSVALSGTRPSANMAVAAIHLAPAPVALSGTTPATTWTLPGLTLAPGTVALSGASASAAWSVPAIHVAPSAVALSGTPPTVVWAFPDLQLTTGTVLVGTKPSAVWTVPTLQLGVGSVALAGVSPATTWTAAAIQLTPGAAALSGAAAALSWQGAGIHLVPGAVAFSGAPAASTWACAEIQLVSEGGPQVLIGLRPSTGWTVPTLALAGSVALVGTAPSTAWATAVVDVTAWTVLTGTTPAATWMVPVLTLAAGTVAVTGTTPAATWMVPAALALSQPEFALDLSRSSVVSLGPTRDVVQRGARRAVTWAGPRRRVSAKE